jgi:hypothetical protein
VVVDTSLIADAAVDDRPVADVVVDTHHLLLMLWLLIDRLLTKACC